MFQNSKYLDKRYLLSCVKTRGSLKQFRPWLQPPCTVAGGVAGTVDGGILPASAIVDQKTLRGFSQGHNTQGAHFSRIYRFYTEKP